MPPLSSKPRNDTTGLLNKVAQVTIFFWIMKILATTLGEVAGDFLSMTLKLGYWISLGITLALLIVVLFAQIKGKRFHSALYWAAIIATTTAGTEVSDLMDRTLGLGYTLGALILFSGLAATLFIWFVASFINGVIYGQSAYTNQDAGSSYYLPDVADPGTDYYSPSGNDVVYNDITGGWTEVDSYGFETELEGAW